MTGKEALIKQILFPKIILPVTSALSQVVELPLRPGACSSCRCWLAYPSHLTVQVVWVPLIAVVQFIFMLGFTFMVASVTVFYRDVGIVIGHLMRLLFWISPILWSFKAVAGRGQALQKAMADVDRTLGLPVGTMFNILHYNPIAQLLEAYRQVIYGNLVAVDAATAGASWSGRRRRRRTSRAGAHLLHGRRVRHHRHDRLQAARAGLREAAVTDGRRSEEPR